MVKANFVLRLCRRTVPEAALAAAVFGSGVVVAAAEAASSVVVAAAAVARASSRLRAVRDIELLTLAVLAKTDGVDIGCIGIVAEGSREGWGF